MKKYISILILLFMTTFISACSAVPDEVKNDMSNYWNVDNDINDQFEFTYIKTTDLKDDVEKALAQNYNQFNLSENIDFLKPEEINIMTFKYTENFEKNYIDILKLFFTQKEIEFQKINSSIDNTGSLSYSFWNEADKIYGCVSDNGFIAVLKPDAFDISFSYNEPNVKIYHIDRGDDLSDVYQLKNGRCSIEEAVDYINNWFATEYKTFASDYDYNVKTVIVREHEDYYLFEITVEVFYHGIPLDSITMISDTDEKNQAMYMKYTSNKIEIQMINVNQIDSFTNCTGILEPIETEIVDECISLESALRYCEKTFTDFKDVTISDIGLKYITSPVYDYIGNESIMQNPYSAGITVNSHPVWEFIIDVEPSEFLRDGEKNTYGDVRKYIYIDIITGELFYQLDTVLQGTE